MIGQCGDVAARLRMEPSLGSPGKTRLPSASDVGTGTGRLPHQAIIHVAGINMLWRSSEASIRGCVGSAMARAREH